MEHPNFFLASFSRRVVTSSPCSPQLNSPGRCWYRDGVTCVTKVLAHRVSCNEGPLEATFLRSVGSSKHETEWRLAQEVIMSHAQLLFTKLFFNCMSHPLFRYKVTLLATFYLSANKIFSNLENFWHPTLKGESLQSQIQATTAQSFRGLSGHWKCTSFYTSRRCTSPRCVKLKRLSATAFAYRGCMYFFCGSYLKHSLTPTNPSKHIHKKTQKTKNKAKNARTHTHTQWIPTKKPMQRHTAKLFAIPGETWEPPPLSKRTPRSQPYGGGLGETVESLDFFWSLEMIAVWPFFFSEVISWKDSFDDQQKQEVLVLGGNPYDKHQGSILRKFFAYCSSISATDFSTVQSIAQEQDLDIPNWYFSWRNRVLSLL